MAGHKYEDLLPHVGHEIRCVEYVGKDKVAIECITCGVVLTGFDKPSEVFDPCPECGSTLGSKVWKNIEGFKCPKCRYAENFKL